MRLSSCPPTTTWRTDERYFNRYRRVFRDDQGFQNAYRSLEASARRLAISAIVDRGFRDLDHRFFGIGLFDEMPRKHRRTLAVLTLERRCYGIKTERLQDGATFDLHA